MGKVDQAVLRGELEQFLLPGQETVRVLIPFNCPEGFRGEVDLASFVEFNGLNG